MPADHNTTELYLMTGHLLWANRAIIDHVESLNETELARSTAGEYRTVQETLFHLVMDIETTLGMFHETNAFPTLLTVGGAWPGFSTLR